MSHLGAGETGARLGGGGATMVLGATTVRLLADRHLTDGRYSLSSTWSDERPPVAHAQRS